MVKIACPAPTAHTAGGRDAPERSTQAEAALSCPLRSSKETPRRPPYGIALVEPWAVSPRKAVIAVSEPESDPTRAPRMPGTVRVLLVMAEGVAAHRTMGQLDAAEELELVGLAGSKDAALTIATDLRPDVALVHAELPDAAETAQLLKKLSVPVLILTGEGATVADTLVNEQVVASGFVDGTRAGADLGASVAIAAVLAAASLARGAAGEA